MHSCAYILIALVTCACVKKQKDDYKELCDVDKLARLDPGYI